LVDQLLKAGPSGVGIPETRSTPVIFGTGNVAPLLEDSQKAFFVLSEAGATIADKFFFDEDPNRLGTFSQTALVKRGDNCFNVGLAFPKGNLHRGSLRSAPRLREAALIQLPAEKRENRRYGFDLLNSDVLALFRDEANDALGRLLGDDGRQPGVHPILFIYFALILAAKFPGLENSVKRGGAAEGAKFEAVLSQRREMATPAIQRVDVVAAQGEDDPHGDRIGVEMVAKAVLVADQSTDRLRDSSLK
jgi:hypothetical protein